MATTEAPMQYLRGAPPRDAAKRKEWQAYQDSVTAQHARLGIVKTTRTTTRNNGLPSKPSMTATKLAALGSAADPELAEIEKLGKDVDDEYPHLTDKEVLTMVRSKMDTMRYIVTSACAGDARAVIISGSPGVSKTFTVSQICQKAVETRGIKYTMIKGADMSAIMLYKTLYEHSDSKSVLIFDDSDTMLLKKETINMLKVALDTDKNRLITWGTASRLLGEWDVPAEFLFDGTIVFITNLNINRIIANSATNEKARHLAALKGRCFYVDLMLHGNRSTMLWVQYLVEKTHMLQNLPLSRRISPEEETMLVKFMLDNRLKLNAPNLRTAEQVARLFVGDPSQWERHARNLLFKV